MARISKKYVFLSVEVKTSRYHWKKFEVRIPKSQLVIMINKAMNAKDFDPRSLKV